MRILVVNQRHTKSGEYIGRPSVLGNPFTHIPQGTLAEIVVASREEAIARYREFLFRHIENKTPAIVNELVRLADIARSTGELKLRCWCVPLACHGEVIKAVLEQAIVKSMLRVLE